MCCGGGREGDNKLLDISVIYAEYSVFQIAACKLFAQHYVCEVVGAGGSTREPPASSHWCLPGTATWLTLFHKENIFCSLKKDPKTFSVKNVVTVNAEMFAAFRLALP